MCVHLVDFRFRNVANVRAGYATPLVMYLQHNASRLNLRLCKKLHKCFHYKFHGSVVIIVQYNSKPTCPMRSLPTLCFDFGAGFGTTVLVGNRHSSSRPQVCHRVLSCRGLKKAASYVDNFQNIQPMSTATQRHNALRGAVAVGA